MVPSYRGGLFSVRHNMNCCMEMRDRQAVPWLDRLVTGHSVSNLWMTKWHCNRFSLSASVFHFVLKSTLNWTVGRSLGHRATKVMLIGKSTNVKKKVLSLFYRLLHVLVLELWIVLMHIKALWKELPHDTRC